jgi:molybdate/tungstate transport system permease protein
LITSPSSRTPGVLAAIASSLLLLFLVLPVVHLVAAAGPQGAARLWTDAELRQSLALTAMTATAATLLGALSGAPLAWLLARRAFRGRALVAAVLDLPLLIPHPVAGIALLLLLGRGSAIGGSRSACASSELRSESSPRCSSSPLRSS